jgi:hypothetical protein
MLRLEVDATSVRIFGMKADEEKAEAEAMKERQRSFMIPYNLNLCGMVGIGCNDYNNDGYY